MSTWGRSLFLLLTLLLLTACEQGAGESGLPHLLAVNFPESYEGLRITPQVESAGPIQQWAWDFGEGTTPATSTAAVPTVELLDAGEYTGRVTVVDAAGHADTLTFDYRIRPAEPPSIITIAPAGIAGGAYTEVGFAVTTTTPATELRWNFGGGAEAVAQPTGTDPLGAQVRLGDPGSYTGTVRVCGDRGCGASQSFAYTVRPATFAWEHAEFRPDGINPALGIAEDGRLVLVWWQVDAGNTRFGNRRGSLQLATAAQTDSPASLVWEQRQLTPRFESCRFLSMVLSGSTMQLVMHLDQAIEPDRITQLLQTNLDGGETLLLPLSTLPDFWLGDAELELHRLESSLLLSTIDSVYSPGPVHAWTAPMQTAAFASAWQVITLPAERGIRALDALMNEGRPYIALADRVGIQHVDPSTIRIGYPHGDLATGSWTWAAIDPGARACPTIAIVPTAQGLEVLYGAYQGTRPEPTGDGWNSGFAIDLAMRRAWTAQTQFTGPEDWETGFAPELPLATRLWVLPHRDRPLAVGCSDTYPLDFTPSFSFTQGYSALGGAIPWSGSSAEYSSWYLESFVATSASDGGAWTAFVDNRSAESFCGHTVCGFEFFDPVLMIGKVTLE